MTMIDIKLFLVFSSTIFALGLSNNSKVNDTAKLIFVGDISFDGPVRYFVEKKQTCDYKFLFKKIRKFLADADFRVGNLECALIGDDNANVDIQRKGIHHGGSTKAIEGLTYAGFNLMQLSNNHFSDFGYYGMNSTTDTLKKAGIEYVGVSNAKRNHRQKPVIKQINGVKIGFLAYCQQKEGCDRLYSTGPAVFERKLAKKEIRRLKKLVDIVVVLLHWSKELLPVPPKGVRDIANFLNLVGADLIIGQHPHVTQGHECIKESLAVYSLGNFLFLRGFTKADIFIDQTPTEREVKQYLDRLKVAFNPTQFAYMFRVTLSRKGIVDAEYLQIEIKNDPKTKCFQPTPVTGHWEKFCDDKDQYCYHFDSVHEANVEMLDKDDFVNNFVNRECILGDAIVMT